MAEYASRGTAIGGLTTGIIGTSLAGLMALNGNGGGGLLGGLLGGDNNKINTLMAENTELKANRYSDDKLLPVLIEQAKQGEQIVAINQKIDLNQQITDGKLANVALTANSGISQLQGALDCLRHTVDGISSTYVPAAKVTPLPAPNPFPPVPPYGFPFVPPPFPPFVPPVVVAPSTGTTGGGTDVAAGAK